MNNQNITASSECLLAVGYFLAEHKYYPTFLDGRIDVQLRNHSTSRISIWIEGDNIRVTRYAGNSVGISLADPDSFDRLLALCHEYELR